MRAYLRFTLFARNEARQGPKTRFSGSFMRFAMLGKGNL